MKPFRERNPVTIGAFGGVVVLLLLLAAFNADRLPFIGGGTDYHAAFREAAGLKPKAEVRIAGVKVGKVTGVGLEGSHVRIDFRVDHGVSLGSTPFASIRIRTVLGQKYLAIDPAGDGNLAKGSEIPLSRSASPFDVLDAVGGLSQTVEKIDTVKLAQAFDAISGTFKDSPAEVRASLAGLSRLSKTISSRDAQLQTLLQHANGVTTVLADRDAEFVKLVSDGNLLLVEVQHRRAAIHRLLVSTSALSVQLIGLVQDNQNQLRPAMQQLAGVVAILQRNEKSLAKGIALLAPFVQGFANVVGNGRWFDTYIANLCGPVLGGALPPGGVCQ
ncbi:MAG: ABC transporter substrate-binding protein [Pseudonocardiales bacterium]|nr:MAG: ABC transporter substrate-binding protein [Pseudonocardiales bacterium]